MQQTRTRNTLPSHLRNEIKKEPPSVSTPSVINRNPTSGQAQKFTAPITPVTTPLHHLQAQHLPPEKRVTLSKPSPQVAAASIASNSLSDLGNTAFDFDSDDTFGLNDEELLALADIEADIGRPIGEGDLGRPIDYNEGLASPEEAYEQVTTEELQAPMQQNMAKISGSMHGSLSREEVIAAALQSREKLNSTSNSEERKVSVVPASGKYTPPSSSTTKINVPVSSSGSSLPQRQQEPKTTAVTRQQLQQHVKQKRQQQNTLGDSEARNQIPQNNNRQEIEGDGAVKRFPTSSTMGGRFNFPPSMVWAFFSCTLSSREY